MNRDVLNPLQFHNAPRHKGTVDMDALGLCRVGIRSCTTSDGHPIVRH